MKKRALSKKVNKSNKKNKLVLVLFVINLILICFLVYMNPFHVYNNYKFKSNIKNILLKREVTLDELVPFEYDSIYFFQSFSSKEQIENTIGIRSRFIKDNSTDTLGTEVIIIKDNKVKSVIFIDLYEDGFVIEGLIHSHKIESTEDIKFTVEKIEDRYFIRKKDAFNIVNIGDITYKVSSEWDRIDDVYYISEKETFSVDYYKKLSFNDFKKDFNNNYKIDSEEIYIVNTFKGTMVTGLNENGNRCYSVYLPINNKIYIFTLVSNSKSASIELASILKTIGYDEKTI